MAEPGAGPPEPWAAWRQRYGQALQLLAGDDPTPPDALARADALWLARVLPEPTELASHLLQGPAGLHTHPAEAPAPPLPTPPAGPPAEAGPSAATPEASPAGLDPQASLFVAQPGAPGEEQLAARRVPVPVADALPGRAAIERALKPFLRRRASALRRAIDPEATTEASARASAELLASARPGDRAAALVIVPVLRPVAERWFDVALLAEHDEAMQVFDDSLDELRKLMLHHGAFAQVRLWRWSVQGERVVVSTATGLACSPRAMLQAQRPQLVLVFTHGASAHWAGDPLRRFVTGLGQRAVLALVQLLPPHSWGHTLLGDADERVRARDRAAVNQQLQRFDPWRGVYVERAGLSAVPLFSLQPQALAQWARWVMSPRLLAHPAVALDTATPFLAQPELGATDIGSPAGSDGAELAWEPPAEVPGEAALRAQVQQFRSIASEPAFALLRLLAGAWISLPVMRLLLNSLPGPRSVAPLAEVLLSGLLQRQSPPGVPAHELVFEFAPGVREWLHGSLSRDEQRLASAAMAESRDSIRRFVEEKSGIRLASFDALLLDPHGTEYLPASARSFVAVSRQLRALRGGRPEAARPVPATLASTTANTPRNPADPPAAGHLHRFPPVARDQVIRPGLEDQLSRRVLALQQGGRLVILARPGAGGRTLLNRVLRRPAVRARFAGGLWWGADAPPRQKTEPEGLRLAIRFGAAARGADVRIELRWERAGPTDIDFLSPAEAAAHLAQMGLSAAQAEALQPVHQGVPGLVPLVGVGALLGVSRWSVPEPFDADEAFSPLARQVMNRVPPERHRALLDLAVRRPGLPAAAAAGPPDTLVADLARQLGWWCPGDDHLAPALQASVAGWLESVYPEDTQAAHGRLLEHLCHQLPLDARLIPYAQRHWIAHTEGAGGPEVMRRVLFDRRMMQALLGSQPGVLHKQLATVDERGPALDQLMRRLKKPDPAQGLVDHVRGALAPAVSWPGWMQLPPAGLGTGQRGRGIRVAIVSTGIDAEHPELQHLALSGATRDPHGHGTAVAGVLAGAYVGLAPEVRLQVLAPMDAQGSASTAAFLQAFTRLLDTPLPDRPDIVCLPFGSPRPDRVLEDALKALAAAGMLLVAAGGNGSRSSPDFPASLAEVISVGALGADDRPAAYSNHGVDLWAPGDQRTVPLPVSGRGLGAALYGQQNGSSFACAAVAGLAALYAGASGLRGTALRELLLAGATAERHARFNTAVLSAQAEATAPQAPAQVEAVPGQDVVKLQLVDGPALVLHPITASELLDSSQAPTLPNDGEAAPRQRGLAGRAWAQALEVLGVGGPKDGPAALQQAIRRLDEPAGAGLQPLGLRPPAAGGRAAAASPMRLERAPEQPLLVLLHDSLVDTASSFGSLWQHPAQLARLATAFGERFSAYAHATLGHTVFSNVLGLAQALPAGTRLILATHGRGGLVAEVLAGLVARPVLTSGEQRLWQELGQPQALSELQAATELLQRKTLRVDRIVRMACPTEGMSFAQGRLDLHLSVLRWQLEQAGHTPPTALQELLLEVARQRLTPQALPGLAELLPDSALMQWLHTPRDPLPGELRVVAGSLPTSEAPKGLVALVTDLLMSHAGDLLVPTRSMFGGLPRALPGLGMVTSRAGLSHFNYLQDEATARAFVDAILLDQPPGFAPITPASGEPTAPPVAR